MVDFFARARLALPGLHFLVLSQSDPSLILEEFERFEIADEARTITRAAPEEVGAYLAAADAAIAFIRPCPSKISASPTKIAEYLAAGLPIVTGTGIGDVDQRLGEYNSGVLLDSFSSESLDRGVQQLCARMAEPGHRERSRRAAVCLSLTGSECHATPRCTSGSAPEVPEQARTTATAGSPDFTHLPRPNERTCELGPDR
jgi:hypothetical protein